MLSKLPAELLLSIASYLDSHTDTLRLASCCRAFYPLLLPKVFTSLDLIEQRNGHLSHLVHALAFKPALAQAVRTFRVSHGWRPTSGVRYEQEVILPVLKSILGPVDDYPNGAGNYRVEGIMTHGLSCFWPSCLIWRIWSCRFMNFQITLSSGWAGSPKKKALVCLN
jgi:hypothetical protein